MAFVSASTFLATGSHLQTRKDAVKPELGSTTHVARRRRAVIMQAEKETPDGENPFQDSDSQSEFQRLMLNITKEETSLSNFTAAGMSHKYVKFDENGDGPRDRYVYVEEMDCIGCTHCATTATETFCLEEEHGRARVFNQTGDGVDVVELAIDTCPVNCIYYVDWEDLVALEKARENQRINNKSRLVGGQDISSTITPRKRDTSLDSAIIRCSDCPGRGCAECPMYGVGQSPVYLRKKKMREARRAQKKNLQRKRKVF